MSSCMRRERTRAAGSCLQPPRVVPFSGIGARAGLCGTSLLGRPRGGGGGGEEDQVDSLLRSSSTPAVAHAGLVWLVLLALCSLLCLQARDAPHHGRYAPEGQLLEVYRKIGLSGR